MAPVPWRSAGLAFLAKRGTGEHLHPPVHNARPKSGSARGIAPSVEALRLSDINYRANPQRP